MKKLEIFIVLFCITHNVTCQSGNHRIYFQQKHSSYSTKNSLCPTNSKQGVRSGFMFCIVHIRCKLHFITLYVYVCVFISITDNTSKRGYCMSKWFYWLHTNQWPIGNLGTSKGLCSSPNA